MLFKKKKKRPRRVLIWNPDWKVTKAKAPMLCTLCTYQQFMCSQRAVSQQKWSRTDFCQPLGFSSYTLTWSKCETSKPCIKTVFWEPWTKDTFSTRRTTEAHSSFLLRFQYHFPPWLCLPLQLSISSLSRALEISLADVKSGSIEPAKARMYSTCDSTSFDKQWSYLEVPSQLPKFYKCGLVVGRLR